jgi:hypothetical protein
MQVINGCHQHKALIKRYAYRAVSVHNQTDEYAFTIDDVINDDRRSADDRYMSFTVELIVEKYEDAL